VGRRLVQPEVFVEYADLVLFLANLGVEVFRLDAVAFLWKRLGTNCQNQPEVHAITQALRALAQMTCPAVAFKADTIVGPADLVHYLGQGHHHGKVSDLAYHNTLMVQCGRCSRPARRNSPSRRCVSCPRHVPRRSGPACPTTSSATTSTSSPPTAKPWISPLPSLFVHVGPWGGFLGWMARAA
jgi:hypothetical protein